MGQGTRVENDSTAGGVEVQRAVMRCLRANGQYPQWEEVWEEMTVWRHKQSILSTQQQVNSTAYSRSRSRDGTFFLVYLESGQGRNLQHVPAAMQAQNFLRLVHPSQPSQVARLVVARTCRLTKTQSDPDLAYLLLQGPKGADNLMPQMQPTLCIFCRPRGIPGIAGPEGSSCLQAPNSQHQQWLTWW
jgi:hypothetical protein